MNTKGTAPGRLSRFDRYDRGAEAVYEANHFYRDAKPRQSNASRLASLCQEAAKASLQLESILEGVETKQKNPSAAKALRLIS